MSTRTSVLIPEPQPLWLPLLFAVMMHGCVGGSMLFVDFLDLAFLRKPLIDPRDQIEVSLVQMKATKDLPTRATVAPVPTGELKASEPPKPPPVKESDLKFVEPKAVQHKGAPDRSSEREALLRDLERKAALERAMEGAKDREATDPNSDADETLRAGTPGLTRADPELARYMMAVEDLFKKNFKPLPTIVAANPGIVSVYAVDFDPDTGRVLGFSAYEPSGNRSYDAAVERAIQVVTQVPLPPERFRETVGTRLIVHFEPP